MKLVSKIIIGNTFFPNLLASNSSISYHFYESRIYSLVEVILSEPYNLKKYFKPLLYFLWVACLIVMTVRKCVHACVCVFQPS